MSQSHRIYRIKRFFWRTSLPRNSRRTWLPIIRETRRWLYCFSNSRMVKLVLIMVGLEAISRELIIL